MLMGQGSQLFEELCVQDDGEHPAPGLRGDRGAGGQNQSGPHRAVRDKRVQVLPLRLEPLWKRQSAVRVLIGGHRPGQLVGLGLS